MGGDGWEDDHDQGRSTLQRPYTGVLLGEIKFKLKSTFNLTIHAYNYPGVGDKGLSSLVVLYLPEHGHYCCGPTTAAFPNFHLVLRKTGGHLRSFEDGRTAAQLPHTPAAYPHMEGSTT